MLYICIKCTFKSLKRKFKLNCFKILYLKCILDHLKLFIISYASIEFLGGPVVTLRLLRGHTPHFGNHCSMSCHVAIKAEALRRTQVITLTNLISLSADESEFSFLWLCFHSLKCVYCVLFLTGWTSRSLLLLNLHKPQLQTTLIELYLMCL